MSTTVARSSVKTGRSYGNVITQDYQTPVYASSVAITTTNEETIVKVGTLTGALTLTAVTTNALIGDRMSIMFTADATGRTVTFSTGFGGITTLDVGSSASAISTFQYNGTSWVFVTAGTYVSQGADVQTPAYAASIAVTTTARKTEVIPAALTGALSLTAVVTSAVAGDTMDFLFLADSTARVVTFSTNLTSAGTITVPASSNAGVRFIYNGTAWIEECRGDLRAKTDIQTPAYGATISLTTTKKVTILQPATLTGALTINAVTTSAVAGDLLFVSFVSDGTGRVVTFGTNFVSSGTLTLVASKKGGASFLFDGTAWVAIGREIAA